MEIIKRIFSAFNNNKQEAPSRVLWTKEKFPQYSIGRWTYDTDLVVYDWNQKATLSIGSFCSIGRDVNIFLGGEHRTDWITTFPFPRLWPEFRSVEGHPRSKGSVKIGSDVWIGLGATVLSGVSIGHGAVVGARSVVTKNISPYAIVAGNPARVVRYRFSKEVIERLLRISWWEWDEKRIIAAMPYLLSKNVEEFIDFFEEIPNTE